MDLETKHNNEKDLFQLLSQNYSEILPPNKETLLLIVWLYKKITNGYILEDFEQRDLDNTVDDVIEFLKTENDKNKELLYKKISEHYLQTESVGNKYRVRLTIFAKKFCELLIEEIQPEIEKLELFHIFQRTLPLQEDDLLNIDKLSYWFDNHFKPARDKIHAHIDKLYNEVTVKIMELGSLLKANADNPKEQIDSYSQIFSVLTERVQGIINTIDYKNDTLKKIKSEDNSFSINELTFEKYTRIQEEVDSFFQSIDRRIITINGKIQLASRRLSNLLDTLKHKQQHKIKIEKLLFLMLKNNKREKGKVILNNQFKTIELPFIQTKFVSIPKIDFQIYNTIKPQKTEYDKQHEQEEREKGLALLEIQESTAKWLDEINKELQTKKILEFDKLLDRIVEKENNLEVPIQVCFGLVETHNKSENTQVIIEKESITKKDLSLWKMKIQNTHS
jgi:hypothetical protein